MRLELTSEGLQVKFAREKYYLRVNFPLKIISTKGQPNKKKINI